MRFNLTIDINDEKLHIGRKQHFRLLEAKNLEYPSYDFQRVKHVLRDGTSIRNIKARDRVIILKVEYVGPENIEIIRSRLASFFDPRSPGYLYYSLGRIDRRIKIVPEDLKMQLYNIYRKPVFDIYLYAPDPFWQDTYETLFEITDWEGGFEFPLELPTFFGQKSNVDEDIIMTNVGDVETPLRIYFYGRAVNPRVTNATTGEFLQVNKVLSDKEVLEIITEKDNKSVKIINIDTGEEEDVFRLLDIRSTFFTLDPGDNIFTYKTELGQDEAVIHVYWRNRFIGV